MPHDCGLGILFASFCDSWCFGERLERLSVDLLAFLHAVEKFNAAILREAFGIKGHGLKRQTLQESPRS